MVIDVADPVESVEEIHTAGRRRRTIRDTSVVVDDHAPGRPGELLTDDHEHAVRPPSRPG
jgi:uncharacterized protein (UPF0276 family)